jgi:flavin-dependent thymidylate synthase
MNNNKKIPFNTKNEHPENAISPLNNNKIDEGTKNIIVKLIDYPDEKRMKNTLAKMVMATIGNDINNDTNQEVGEELFKGGLQTGLEAFVFVFEISGVSRAFTHQFVRTRKASYHQQSSRYTDMGDYFNVRMPESISKDEEARIAFIHFIDESRKAYSIMKERNIPFQDARFTCPIGLETYIIGEFPIKVFLDTYAYRACPLFQWEITYVFREMKKEVIKIFPWMNDYIKISCEKNHKCMFQGWEKPEEYCDFEWAGDRIYNPNLKEIFKNENKDNDI